MTTNSEQKPDAKPRILLYSERNLYEREVWRCPFYEFERILQETDAVDLLAPKRTRWYKDRLRASLKLGNYTKAALVSPGIAPIKLDKDYEVFFTVIEKPGEALNIQAIKNLKERCKTSICWVTEFYVWNMKTHRSSLEMLKEFDQVIFWPATMSRSRRSSRGRSGTWPRAWMLCAAVLIQTRRKDASMS